MADIEPFHVMDVQDRAHELEAKGRRIIHMEIGQPDFPAPPPVAEAAIEAIRRRRLGYTASIGIPELRRAISDYYRDRLGVAVPPSRIVVTAGASGAFLLVLGVLVNPGDEVLLPDPCYPCNRHFVRLFEGRPRAIPVGASRQYQLTDADVRANWGRATRGRGELRAIIGSVRRAGGFVVVDEIYQGLVYDGEASTALELADDVFVVNSFSKYFNMTGWRLGWIVAPESHVREIEKLAQNAFICPSAPAQYAALAAFRADTLSVLEERRREFQRRRDYMVPALRELGFRIPVMPQGAFYIYAGCESFSADSADFTLRVLEEAGVAITPGLDFGSNRSEGHVRFAYTRSLEDLKEGVGSIARMLQGSRGPVGSNPG
ncbi:MAG: aminotransferase class I/II-fold pyridoxal phosphate-dependent enzyme [Bacillati bacterium ANGP1]|uniref:Aminotransferase n=1 Tax=Candidatus Segetimicrobium genomatis TaxID=2569760 RepID=A0A537IMI4_9BACT|nr:MAG: aminotransferase class I/II-fold pyridoxal phosphate-dependent enzyme [Terrabacteria group bacterium ANGP1]